VRQGKREVARALAAGRTTLPRAAAQFRELSRDDPTFSCAVERFSPSGTEGEKLCRYVIDWTEVALEDEPEKARAAARRLHAELHERLRTGSPLVEP
jgi:hypothetical protein